MSLTNDINGFASFCLRKISHMSISVTYACLKEIGIRKVLGASTGKLIALLSKDFLKLIIIAILISCPLAFWGSQKWLQDFAYRTKMDIWIFVLAAFLTTAITLLTVFFNLLKLRGLTLQKFLGMDKIEPGIMAFFQKKILLIVKP